MTQYLGSFSRPRKIWILKFSISLFLQPLLEYELSKITFDEFLRNASDYKEFQGTFMLIWEFGLVVNSWIRVQSSSHLDDVLAFFDRFPHTAHHANVLPSCEQPGVGGPHRLQ